MPENSKTQEFLLKLAPYIECGKLDGCMEEAALQYSAILYTIDNKGQTVTIEAIKHKDEF